LISRALSGEPIQLVTVEQRTLVYYCRSLVRELDLGVFSNETVKDVPGHFVNHVVGLDTGFGLSEDVHRNGWSEQCPHAVLSTEGLSVASIASSCIVTQIPEGRCVTEFCTRCAS
jgi:hypothetical protein